MPDTMTNRERYRTTFSRRQPDRIPMWEVGVWPETLALWYEQGLPRETTPHEYLGMDPLVNLHPDSSLRLPVETLEESEEFSIARDANGVTKRHWRHRSATPHELDFVIKTQGDWDRHKERLLDDGGRITPEIIEGFRAARRDELFSAVSPYEPIWWIVQTVGYAESLVFMASEPDWVGEMIEYQTALTLRMLQTLLDADAAPDALWFWSDLCYKNGMLFSPRMYRSMFMDAHKRIARFCHDHDMLLILHCDGYIGEFIPLLIESGFDVLQPVEARCGNDVRDYKPLYGRDIAFFGNISSDELAKGPDAAEAEVRAKVTAAKPGGGYAYHSDHSVPPTVTWESFKRAAETCREIGVYE
jgi:uroporphyrinogen decarboxylase